MADPEPTQEPTTPDPPVAAPEPGADPKPDAPEPKWPDNWRAQIAGADEKALKQLERYSTPADIWTKARNLERRVTSGELRATLPEDASDEQVAEYRKDHGIPEKAEDYDLTFDDGFVVAEEDKPVIAGFLETAHAENMPPSAVKRSLRWYYETLEKQNEEREQRDVQLRESAEDELREEYGPDYRKNMTLLSNFVSGAPEAIRERFLHGRLDDGTPIGSSPDVIRWFVQLAREANPMGTLTGPGTEQQGRQLDERINEIQQVMRTDRTRYNRENMHKELEELLELKQRLEARAA